MITLPGCTVDGLSLPTGSGASVPGSATTDFAALFACVAVVSSEGSSVPVAVTIPPTDELPIDTESDMPVTQALPTPFSITPPISTVTVRPDGALVAQSIDKASAPKQAEPKAAVQQPDDGDTPVPTADALLVSSAVALFVAGPVDQPINENAIAPIAPAADQPVSNALPLTDRTVRHQAPVVDVAVVGIAATVVGEPAKRATGTPVERTESPVVLSIETRAAPLAQIPEKPLVPLSERAAPFAAIVSDAVRDLATLARDKDVRFNVRPEMLGPVAVTIERTDAGPALRLGVETHAAVQAVRLAEPTMNDARGSAPFVQITVDMNAPESRGRSPRAMPPQQAAENHVLEPIQRQLPVSTGRYA